MGITIKLYSKNYYLRSAGNDNNTGLSDAQAWLTIAKVNASSFSPGDTIFFNKGDTWREPLILPSSGSSSAKITFTCYGTGNAPKILGSEEVTAWTYDAGNVWYSDNTISDPYDLRFDGGIYFKETDGDLSWGRVKKSSKGALAAEYDWIWISNHIYIYSPTDPNTRYSGAEITQRISCININNKENITFDGLDIAYGGTTGIAGNLPFSELSGLIVKNCHIHHIGVKNSEAGFGLSIWYSNMIIKNNIIHDIGRRPISLNLYTENISPHNVIIEGNTFYDGYHTSGIDIATEDTGSWDSIIIRNNLFYQNTNPIDLVENMESNGMYIAEQTGIPGTLTNIYIYNNIFKYASNFAILFENVSSAYIYNNTFYAVNANATVLNRGMIGISGAGSYTIKNNIFYNGITYATNNNFRSLSVSPTAGTVTSDYNLFYNTDPLQTLVTWRGTSYTPSQWASYRSETGQDSHSPTPIDPLLVSSSDYHLKAGSHAIGTGVNVGLKTDYDGNTFNNPPSIGASEYDSKPALPVIPVYQSSFVENTTPSVIEITYSLSLTNVFPAASAFLVNVNSVARIVNAITISGTKVLLTLATPVVYGNNVTVSYTKPTTNPLQTPSGGQAVTISAQIVTNKVNAVSVVTPVIVNTPPVVSVNYSTVTYSGFMGILDASGSFDADRDNLTFTWNAPDNVPVSAKNGPEIEFLAPIVDTIRTFDFTVTVSDGKASQTKTIPVEIVPYQPGLEAAEVISIDAGEFQSPYYPNNITDGNIGTMWSVNGNDQWIILELSGFFPIQHLKLSFHSGQKKEFYFDIFGSTEKENWEPILTKSKSCAFSGNLQVFEFPSSKAEKQFKYVKLVGQGNSADKWNCVSELRIFGYKHKNPTDYENLPVKIYPNPAYKMISILIDKQTFVPDFIKILTLTGNVVYSDKVDPDVRQFQIPIDFKQGIYVIQMGTGGITMYTQKLIISK